MKKHDSEFHFKKRNRVKIFTVPQITVLKGAKRMKMKVTNNMAVLDELKHNTALREEDLAFIKMLIRNISWTGQQPFSVELNSKDVYKILKCPVEDPCYVRDILDNIALNSQMEIEDAGPDLSTSGFLLYGFDYNEESDSFTVYLNGATIGVQISPDRSARSASGGVRISEYSAYYFACNGALPYYGR